MWAELFGPGTLSPLPTSVAACSMRAIHKVRRASGHLKHQMASISLSAKSYVQKLHRRRVFPETELVPNSECQLKE
jgi:hypothetical protein